MKSRSQALRISLTLCLLLAPLAGRTQTSEWKWLTGGNLKAVKFIGQKGWIIGDDGNQGIILHTTNGGDTWAIQPHNTGRHYFRGLSVTDSLNGWIAGGLLGSGEPGFILRTRNGGQIWAEEYTRSGMHLNDIDYTDSLHGWFSASFPTADTIYRTTNGGVSWQGIQPDTSRNRPYGPIDFVDSLNGCAVSPGGIFTVSRTTDGGLTWTTVNDAFLPALRAIDMADSVRGWTTGEGDVMVRTRDGWRTWQTTTGGLYVILYDISFTDTLNGWAVGGNNGHFATVFHSSNGGVSWSWDTTLTKDNAFYGVNAVNQNTAYAAGAAGSVVKTTNTGNSWTVLRNTDIKEFNLWNIDFYDVNLGWGTGENGVITHTTNGGTVWNRQVSGTFAYLLGVDFPETQRGWVCGSGGTILGTPNGGTTWSPESSNTTFPLWAIDFADTLYGIAVGGYYGPLEPPGPGIRDQGLGFRGQGGTALQNAKCKVQSAKGATNEMLNQVQHDEVQWPRNDTPWIQDTIKIWGTELDFWKWSWRPEEKILQTPYRTITRTTNGGSQWIAQNSNADPLYGVSYVTRTEGWACGPPGAIIHTTDGGATWQNQPSGVGNELNWIQFRNVQNGWCVGSGGTALWTTDGGTTWNRGNTGTTAYLWSCAFYDMQNGFASGDNGLILKTTDGGRNWQLDTSNVHTNLTAQCALDSAHAWAAGGYGVVVGWRLAGTSGVETRGQGDKGTRANISLRAWPNPFVSYARVPGHEKERFALYDITGRKAGVYPGDRIGEGLASGVYFLMPLTGETKPQRIVKIK